MPNKRKPAKNAFSFFLDDAVVRLRNQGKNVRSKQEAVQFVHQEWKEMTAEQKAPYEEFAQQEKLNREHTRRRGRLDCTGNRIEDRIDMDKLMMDERKRQKKYLLDRWRGLKKPEVLEERFYFVSFQSCFEFPDEEGYQPCEVAVVEYSLQHGISNEFHAMINPGPIKLGLGAEAKIYSEQNHKIPTYGFELGRTDYGALWDDLLNFVNPDKLDIFPPLYSRICELRKNTACMVYLAGLAGRSNRLAKIYQWENLVLALYDHANEPAPSLNLIEDGGGSTMYDFERATKCDYHDELECVHCSLLIVKKCCFWISDAFTKSLEFLITERHLPVRQVPQYSVVRSEDIVLNLYGRKRFLGSDVMPAYDPNLPPGLQRQSLRELLQSESSMDEDSVFGTRDIRYRKRNVRHPESGAGRGMVLASWGNTTRRSHDDTVSLAETMDDVASAILEEDDMNSSVVADDEASLDLRRKANARLPRYVSKLIQHPVGMQMHSGDVTTASDTMPALTERLDDITISNNRAVNRNVEKPRPSACDRSNEDNISDSSTADDMSQMQFPVIENARLHCERNFDSDDTLSGGDGAKVRQSKRAMVNEKGKHIFSRSRVGVMALAQKPAATSIPLTLGRGRLIVKSPSINSSTYHSESD